MQKLNVARELEKEKPTVCHMGDCVGADAEFHTICNVYSWIVAPFELVGHIPENSSKRAFCKYDHENFPAPYLQRNRTIVDSSDVLFVCPLGMTEELRSGTWSTFRYARKTGCRTIIFYPNGTMERSVS